MQVGLAGIAIVAAHCLCACSASDNNNQASHATGGQHAAGSSSYGASSAISGSSGYTSSPTGFTGGRKASFTNTSKASDGHGFPGPFAAGDDSSGPFAFEAGAGGGTHTSGTSVSYTGANTASAGGTSNYMSSPTTSNCGSCESNCGTEYYAESIACSPLDEPYLSACYAIADNNYDDCLARCC